MKSTEKVLMFADGAQAMSDRELEEAIPFDMPAPAIRAMFATLVWQLPQDPGELDELLIDVGRFCLSLRSDDELAA